MFSRLASAFSSSNFPSAVLAFGEFATRNSPAKLWILHLVPECATFEQFGIFTPSMTTFRRGATEQSRELLGEITLHVEDGRNPENAFTLLEELQARARKLWDDSPLANSEQTQAEDVGAAQQAAEILRQVALDAIGDRQGRAPSLNAMETYPVYIVRIKRSKPGGLLGEPTSWPS